MSNETEFVDGLIIKAPHEKAPDFVKLRMSIKREELIGWLTQKDGDWINLDVKESRNGKLYAAVDNWKPEGRQRTGNGTPRRSGPDVARGQSADDFEDDIPFISARGDW